MIFIILIIIAGFFLGTFGLGMKYTKPLAYEAWWSLYSISGMVLLPLIWALIVVPNLFQVIGSAPSDAVFNGMLYGFLWGIGGLMFGISVAYVGVSITYGVVMGLSGSVGSLIPLFRIPNAMSHPALPVILLGVGVMLVGVALAAYAGVKRDRVYETESPSAANSIDKSKNVMKGLVIVVICGVLSSLINVGFDYAQPVAVKAIESGVVSRNASLAAWVVVLFGAFILNGSYILFMLVKNKTWHTYVAPGAGRAYRWGILSGLLWFAGLGVYGQGAALMGKLGTVIGWPMFLGLSLVVSNFWAIRAGEWIGAVKPLRIMIIGVVILILACIILGYANGMIT
jgi:L-rhamnose-H+ transport protein